VFFSLQFIPLPLHTLPDLEFAKHASVIIIIILFLLEAFRKGTVYP
jgi:hypothetical protein